MTTHPTDAEIDEIERDRVIYGSVTARMCAAARDRNRLEAEHAKLRETLAQFEKQWRNIIHSTDGSEWEMVMSDWIPFVGKWHPTAQRWFRRSKKPYEPVNLDIDTISSNSATGWLWSPLPAGFYPIAFRALLSELETTND